MTFLFVSGPKEDLIRNFDTKKADRRFTSELNNLLKTDKKGVKNA